MKLRLLGSGLTLLLMTTVPTTVPMAVATTASATTPAANSCPAQLLTPYQDALRIYKDLIATSMFHAESDEAKSLWAKLQGHEGMKNAIEIDGMPGSFLNFSFEKETPSPMITDLLRDPDISEEEWFKIPQEERMKKLMAVKNLPGVAVGVLKTSLAPAYLGKTTFENDHIVETRHESFELDMKKVFEEITEISGYLNETHSIHVHLSFDIFKKDPRRFVNHWFKHINDFLTLHGMANGLFGTHLTDIFPDIWYSPFVDNKKMHSGGLRTGIYRNSISPDDRERIGIELRDTTRDLKTLFQWIREISASLKARRFINPSITEDQKKKMVLLGQPVATPTVWGRSFEKNDPWATIPYLEFENGVYADYRSATVISPTPEQKARIVKARQNYEKKMIRLREEIEEAAAKNEPAPFEDIKTVIRWNLKEWAQESQVYELYSLF